MRNPTSLTITLLTAFCAANLPVSLPAAPPLKSLLRQAQQSQSNAAGVAPLAVQPLDSSHTASNYTLIPIDIPTSSGVQVFEINNHRVASGIYVDATGSYHGFIWERGHVTTIDKPGEQYTVVGSIDDHGRVFGNWGSDALQHAGYYDLQKKVWTQLPDIPGSPINIGMRMNNLGHAVGYACQGTFFNAFPCSAWSWNGSSYTFYQYPSAVVTYPYGINDKGKEVGLWFDPSFIHGYARDKGHMTELTLFTAGQVFTPTAYDINDSGPILSAAPLNPTGYWPSFILRDENTFTLLPDYPGVLRTFYQGMNEREDLVGIWFNDPSATAVYSFVALRKDD